MIISSENATQNNLLPSLFRLSSLVEGEKSLESIFSCPFIDLSILKYIRDLNLANSQLTKLRRISQIMRTDMRPAIA